MKPGFRGKIHLGFFILLMFQGLVIFLWFSHVMKASVLDEIKTGGFPSEAACPWALWNPCLPWTS